MPCTRIFIVLVLVVPNRVHTLNQVEHSSTVATFTMSYLLRNQHRLSSKPGSTGSIHYNKGTLSFPRSSLSSGLQQSRQSSIHAGGGGGQVQIQRQQQHHHAPQQQLPPQQQQQQRVQGVISMEEGTFL